eukprot:jgi/Ulvmu1/5726/UM240_0001.1
MRLKRVRRGLGELLLRHKTVVTRRPRGAWHTKTVMRARRGRGRLLMRHKTVLSQRSTARWPMRVLMRVRRGLGRAAAALDLGSPPPDGEGPA